MIRGLSHANYNQIKDIKVFYYGVFTPLENTCNITEDNGYILLQPWEKNTISNIIKAIEDKYEWQFFNVAMNIIRVTPISIMRDQRINEILG